MRFTLMLVLLASALVFAQDGGVSLAVALGAPTLPDPGGDPTAIVALLVAAAKSGHWAFVVAFVVAVIVYTLRKMTPENSTLGAWFRSKLGGLIANAVSSFSVTVAGSLYFGQAFGWPVVAAALGVTLTAAGGWSIYKNLMEGIDEMKAAKAGVAQAAAVTAEVKSTGSSPNDPLAK